MKTAADLRPRLHSLLNSGLGPRDLVLALCGASLVLAPLAYGAVHPWAYVSLGLGLAALSILLLLRLALAPAFAAGFPATLPRPPLWGLVLAAALLVLLPTGAPAPGPGQLAFPLGRPDQVMGERLWLAPPDTPFFKQQRHGH